MEKGELVSALLRQESKIAASQNTLLAMTDKHGRDGARPSTGKQEWISAYYLPITNIGTHARE